MASAGSPVRLPKPGMPQVSRLAERLARHWLFQRRLKNTVSRLLQKETQVLRMPHFYKDCISMCLSRLLNRHNLGLISV
jgi:hypothetical protein